ncbi:MAG: hypothetical protein JNG88_09575 [Phycisphaerales bacterium]|nr:hypothetical protein [Phycisphaerales bacterium]
MMVIIGVVIAAFAHHWGVWRWPIASIAILLGLFGLYEARRGWCALRAMGFRTPI